MYNFKFTLIHSDTVTMKEKTDASKP